MIQNRLQLNPELKQPKTERRPVIVPHEAAIGSVINFIYFSLGVVEVLLVVRLIWYMLNMNTANSFAQFTQVLSRPFPASFTTLPRNPTLIGVMEPITTTLTVMLVCAVVVLFSIRLLRFAGRK